MILERQTVSLCNVCYREIPAVVRVGKEVTIHKRCSQHGEQSALLEPDPVFYMHVAGMRCPSIYAGYFIDVTRRCNLRCGYCYFPLEKQDPDGLYSIESILDDCAANAANAPFVFIGGEPTVRDDIADLVRETSKLGIVSVVTNGVKLAEGKPWDELAPVMAHGKIVNLNLSIHLNETDKWKEVIKLARRDGVQLESALIVIDSKEGFFRAAKLTEELKDAVQAFRIKAASCIWNEQKPGDAETALLRKPGQRKVYVSDMLNWLEELGGCQIVTQRHNKSVFVNVMWRGIYLMLVAWHDTTNVDLLDIDCAPYYRARNGEVANFVTASLINEGMDAGWLKGRKLPK